MFVSFAFSISKRLTIQSNLLNSGRRYLHNGCKHILPAVIFKKNKSQHCAVIDAIGSPNVHAGGYAV